MSRGRVRDFVLDDDQTKSDGAEFLTEAERKARKDNDSTATQGSTLGSSWSRIINKVTPDFLKSGRASAPALTVSSDDSQTQLSKSLSEPARAKTSHGYASLDLLSDDSDLLDTPEKDTQTQTPGASGSPSLI